MLLFSDKQLHYVQIFINRKQFGFPSRLLRRLWVGLYFHDTRDPKLIPTGVAQHGTQRNKTVARWGSVQWCDLPIPGLVFGLRLEISHFSIKPLYAALTATRHNNYKFTELWKIRLKKMARLSYLITWLPFLRSNCIYMYLNGV